MIVSVELEAKTCPTCGVMYAVPKDWLAAKSRAHDRGDRDVNWFCPNGHSTVFSREAETVVLKRERDRLKQENARLEQIAAEAQQKAAAVEAQARIDHRRTVAGVCPCCNRTFRQLATHMRHMHPEVAARAQSKGGRARAAAMTPERRSAIAKEAAHKRWHGGAHG